MKSKSAKVNGSAGSRWRPTSSCSEWKVPSGSLSRRRISSGRYSASPGSLLGRSSDTGIRPMCRSSSRTSCSRRATSSGWRARKLLTSNERRRCCMRMGRVLKPVFSMECTDRAMPLMSSCGALPSGVAKVNSYSFSNSLSTWAISTRKNPVEIDLTSAGSTSGSWRPDEMRINARRLVVGMTVAPLLSWCGTGGPVGRLVEGGDWFGGELCRALRSSVEERGEDRAGGEGGGRPGEGGRVGVDGRLRREAGPVRAREVGGGRAGRDRREQRGADRAADLLAGVDGGGGDAGVVGVDAARAVVEGRGED